MENHTFVVGQEFPDVKAFRNAIKEAAIAQHFELRIIKSDLIRYFAKCASEGCPWRIRAVKLPNVPTFTVIERIHSKLMAEFQDRQMKSNSWFSVLAPSTEKRMIEAINHASAYQVLRSDEVEFEVLSAERSDIVNIGTHSCSCRGWQLYGIPCSHAVAALVSCRKDVYTFTEKCFTVAGYREAYAETIHPIPERIEWRKMSEAPMDDDDDDDDAQVVRPPKFRRPPGRPEKKRICVEDDLNLKKNLSARGGVTYCVCLLAVQYMHALFMDNTSASINRFSSVEQPIDNEILIIKVHQPWQPMVLETDNGYFHSLPASIRALVSSY
ncbi:hypothetical protein D5086_018187 [Populus alba]|uniref:Uncharacterized protein n=1 Tax=Populus alba TaxID=43335 RepID=A0ACC4BPK7_POPAL